MERDTAPKRTSLLKQALILEASVDLIICKGPKIGETLLKVYSAQRRLLWEIKHSFRKFIFLLKQSGNCRCIFFIKPVASDHIPINEFLNFEIKNVSKLQLNWTLCYLFQLWNKYSLWKIPLELKQINIYVTLIQLWRVVFWLDSPGSSHWDDWCSVPA